MGLGCLGAMAVTVYAALIHRTYARRWTAGTPRLNHGLTPVVMAVGRLGAVAVTVYAALIHRTYARRWTAGTPRLNHGLTPVVMAVERDFGARIHELLSKTHDACNGPTSKSLW
jgi:hypothetical protein